MLCTEQGAMKRRLCVCSLFQEATTQWMTDPTPVEQSKSSGHGCFKRMPAELYTGGSRKLSVTQMKMKMLPTTMHYDFWDDSHQPTLAASLAATGRASASGLCTVAASAKPAAAQLAVGRGFCCALPLLAALVEAAG